jgi:acetate kinase
MKHNDRIIGEDAVISLPGARVKTAVVLTDEELAIAVDTYKIVSAM